MVSSNSNPINSQSWIRNHAIYFLLGLMAVLGLINLDRLPIAWNDEIQNLDPALVWHHTQKFCSPLWPNPGAETHFLSYPPLIEAWHCLWLNFGKSPWIVRFPFLVFHLTTALILYRFIHRIFHNTHATSMALLLIALFLFDKSTGEIARSLRVETPILLLFAALITTWHRAQTQYSAAAIGTIGLILGTLGIAHLYTWPLIAMALLLAWLGINQSDNQTALKRLLLLLGCALPFGLFWILVQPNWTDLKVQLFMQADDHSSQSLLQNISDFFVGRFIPYSIEQPYTPFLHVAYFIIAIALFIRQWKIRSSFTHFLLASWIPCLFLSVSIPMMMLLTPQHRYYPIQHFWGLLVIADYLKSIDFTTVKVPTWVNSQKSIITTKILGILFVTSLLLPYSIRHSAAWLQREQRDPHTAIEFLNKNLNHLPAGEILGEPIANYWLAQSPHPKDWRYGFEFYPQHFAFNHEIPRYFLTRISPNQLTFLTPVDQLRIPVKSIWENLPLEKLGHTYNGLYLYQINSEKAWKQLTSPEMLRVTSGH